MAFYSMEQFEIMGDAMDEIRAWEEYEADMAEMDAAEEPPTEEEIEAMFTA